MSIAADSSHYDYINYEKTNLAAKVHGILQTTKNNRCFIFQAANNNKKIGEHHKNAHPFLG
ncbi:hypothetical protein [Xylanibacter ruminicola]|uniref:hypothetical protein n=1 Tax=Xylanibacter ruminicola TaxID=839 RepID=UPI00094346B4|nr:hypothetical protein [Xylanibacter ruminicola]